MAGISAIGDVITFEKPGHAQLAHLSSAEGIALAERIAGQEFRAINYDHVPACTYSDPEIGSVGLTEAEAQGARFRRAGPEASSLPCWHAHALPARSKAS